MNEVEKKINNEGIKKYVIKKKVTEKTEYSYKYGKKSYKKEEDIEYVFSFLWENIMRGIELRSKTFYIPKNMLQYLKTSRYNSEKNDSMKITNGTCNDSLFEKQFDKNANSLISKINGNIVIAKEKIIYEEYYNNIQKVSNYSVVVMYHIIYMRMDTNELINEKIYKKKDWDGIVNRIMKLSLCTKK